MNKIISVLQKTTRQTTVGLVVLGLIVVAAPMAVFATDNNSEENHSESHQIEICHNGQSTEVDENSFVNGHDGDFKIESESDRFTCKNGDSEHEGGDAGTLTVTKVIRGTGSAHFSDFSFTVNNGSAVAFEEDGTNVLKEKEGEYSVSEVSAPNYTTEYSSNVEGHSQDCSHLKVKEERNVTCTITNTYHAPETPKTCVFGSDATTLVGTAPAVASFVHPNWTSALVSTSPLTQWIWNAFHATPSDTTDEVVTFTKKFNVVGTPSSVKLDLAADNYYTVSVNGTPACATGADLDNFSSVEPQCNITSLVTTGVNTLTFVVTNAKKYGTNPETNPGGLIYKVTIGGATCSAVPTTPVASISATKVVCTSEKDLPNWGAGGPDITATTATDWVAEHKSCSIVPWDFQWAPSSVSNPGDNALGTPEGWNAFVSGLTTVPANAFIWVREKINADYIPFTGAGSTDNVSAEMYCSNDVLNYDNFDFINPVEADHTYYCVGFNAPKAPEQTETHETIVVRADDLDSTSSNPIVVLADGLNKWFFYNDTTDVVDNSIGSFVTGPSTAPLGTGSAEMNDPAANSRPDIATFQFSGTKLADITSLAFSSYSHSGVAGPSESAYLVFNVDFTGSSGAFQKRLVYVPGNNGAVPQDTWNTNDTIQGGSGKWVYSGATWPAPLSGSGDTPKIWSEILAAYPNARLLPAGGFIGVRVGEPGPAGYTGNVDKFVIGIKTGTNTDTKTFDFEPAVDLCQNLEGIQATVPQGMLLDDGRCVFPTPAVTDVCQNIDGVQSEIPTGMSLVSGACVTTPTTGGGRSGGRSHGGGGSVLGAFTTGGQVLGESCGLYLEKHLRFGSTKNDSEQTKKLQTFLNKWMGTTLPISGMYDSATEAAVKAFQKKYASDILTPWKIGAPTGLVYFTTLHKINELECPEAAGAKPKNLIDWSKNKNAQ